MAMGDDLKDSMSKQPQVALPKALLLARKAAMDELNAALQSAFDQADDTFFEYSDRSSNSEEKNSYLETMRQLRLLRKDIERRFFSYINDKFKALPTSDGESGRQLESVHSLEGLALVANDELEIKVALENMEAKAKNKFGSQIYQLNTRIDALMIHVSVSERNNPLHPHTICEAFGEAVTLVSCDIQNRLVIFKLFDKFVVSQFDEVLDAANRSLADSGILPDLPGTPQVTRRQRDSFKAPDPAAAAAALNQAGTGAHNSVSHQSASQVPGSQSPGSQMANHFFGQLQSLLASVREVPMVTDVVGGPIGSDASNARVLANAEVFELLNNLQSQRLQDDSLFTAPIGHAALAKHNVPQEMSSLLAQRESAAGPERLNDTDSDVINLVSLLFDFILDDENLPLAIKALLGRLQIPYLKLAVMDHNFFNRSGHPARKLLNEMARAGMGLSEDEDLLKKDMVFKKIQATANRVLQEFNQDLMLFEELLHDFTQFMQTEVRRSQVIEQRTRATEEGKAKAEQAEQVARETVRQRIQGEVLPDVVTRLLSDGWIPVLKLIFLKFGPESNNWVGAVKTIDHLLLSVRPPKDDITRKKLFNIVPILLKNLRQGLNSVSFNPFEMGQMFTELEQIQMQIMRGETRIEDLPDIEDPATELVAAVSEDMARLGATPLAAVDKSNVTTLDITRPSSRSQLPDLADLEAEDPCLIKASTIKVGTWLEFVSDDVRTRCKLAAHIKSADKLIFVNRTGVKIDEKSTLGLAHALKKGDALVLEDSQLFDRALQNVIGNLRKAKQANS